MSYQFEDESALEELLNQQLDRKRQASSLRRQPPPVATSAPQPAASGIPIVNSSSQAPQRPSTASASLNVAVAQKQKQQQPQQQPTEELPRQSGLAGWLSGGARDGGPDVVARDEAPSAAQEKGGDVRRLLEESLREDKLQEMSKQRLIRLIMGELVPALESGIGQPSELARLRRELDEKRAALEAAEAATGGRLRECESKWSQLNRQLEERAEASGRKLRELEEARDKEEARHRQELGELSASYRRRLEEEREQFKAELKRLEEFHKLELESKLRVDCDLNKLDALFREWDRRARATADELERQFRGCEAQLERQSLEVTGTQERLAGSARQLSEQADRFTRQSGELTELLGSLNELMPSFARAQAQGEQLQRELAERLLELTKSWELAESRERLRDERHELALEQGRVAGLEQRLEQLVREQEASKAGARQLRASLEERELALGAARASHELRARELKRAAGELAGRRQELAKRQKRLVRAARELASEREAQRARAGQLGEELERAQKARARARHELAELARLQQSLVCSICLDRLVKVRQPDNKWPPPPERLLVKEDEERLETRRLAEESKYAARLLLSAS